MAKVVEVVSLKLDLQGFAQLQGLGNKFKKLENPIKLAGAGVTKLRNEIMGLGKVTPNTISHLNAQADALTRVRQTVEIGTKEFKELTNEILRVKGAIDKANASMTKSKFGGGGFKRGLGIVGGAMAFGGPVPGISGLAGGLMSSMTGGDFGEGAAAGVGVGFAAKPVIDAIGGTATYASEVQKLQITLKGIVKDQDSYNIALNAAREATERFNIPQEVAIRGITRMSAAVLGAGGHVHNAAMSFLDVTAAIKGSAGSAEDVKAAITALVQIYSKGKVSAEELSGQLGERFPGAVTKFAEANKDAFKSTADLQKGLKDGTVGLDKLEKFLRSLGKEFGPLADEIGKSAQEAGARLVVEMNRLKLAIGSELQPLGAEFQEIFISLLNDLIPTFKTLAESLILVFKGLMPVIKALVPVIELLAKVIGPLGLGLAVNSTVKGIGVMMGMAGIKGLAGAVVFLNAKIKLLTLTMMKNPLFLVGVGAAVAIQAIIAEVNRFKNLLGDVVDGNEEAIEKAKAQLLEIEEQLAKGTKTITLRGSRTKEVLLSQKEIDDLKSRGEQLKDVLKGVGVTYDPEKGFVFKPITKDEKGGDEDKSPWKSFIEEGFKFGQQIEGAFVKAVTGMEDALVSFVQTGKLEFGKLTQAILADLLKIAIRATITQPLLKGLNLLADGGVIAGNNIVPYRKGGVVGAPTMFKYGGSKLGVMGEAGPEAIMPLKRGPSGKLGVEMHGGASRGGVTTVNYTGPTLNFNGDEFVPKSAVNSIIFKAANKGAAMGETRTMRSLQNNRSSRSRVGI